MYSASTATFVTALVFNAAIFGIELAVFTLIRPYFKAIYEPRTYVPKPEKRIAPLSKNAFRWPLAVFEADYRGIISANGLDAYFFVRFLRVMVFILLPIWLVSWAVLLPTTAVKTSTGLKGLDRFTFGNVATNDQSRYAAHLILVYGFTFWIFYHIKQEMRHFVITRQQHLIERTHAKSLFNNLPGGVKKIWINRNLKELPDIYDRRTAACAKLESAETQLLRTAAKLRLKAAKEGAQKDAAPADAESRAIPAEIEVPESDRPTHKLGSIPFFGQKVDSINWAREEIVECTRLLEEKRAYINAADEHGSPEPTTEGDELEGSALDEEGNPRLRKSETKLNPLVAGRQAVDAVEGVAKGAVSGVAKGAQAVKGRVVGSGGAEGEYPPLNSAFITFNKQISAHLAVQVLPHHEPYRMSNRYIEVAPEDVIWSNLGLNPYEQKVRTAISYAATAGLIICWAIPVSFVGVISNVHTLCKTAPFLAWICTLPDVVVGIISMRSFPYLIFGPFLILPFLSLQGILPPVLLAVLMMLLPIVLRLLARFEGIPKYTGLELSLMTRFFIFQVIHSFLIMTLSSGIIAALPGLINNPTSIPNILATNLPQASTFFLTYIVLQGLSGVAGGFLQIVRLIIYYVKLFILGSTPRSVYSIKYIPGGVAWGTLFPSITLLVVITLGYSIISPIINGLACAAFFLFYQLYKYLFLYVYQQPTTTDTGGLFYPKALQHIFVGLYVQQVCLCALFFLARNSAGNASAVPEGALMIVLIVLTAGYNIILNNSYNPLLSALPLSLQDRTYTPAAVESPPAVVDADNASALDEDDGTKSKAPPPKDAADAGAEKQEESYGFAHPAASRPQRIVWIPRDEFGLAQEEPRACKEVGVSVSDAHATMDAKGDVDVNGGPPDPV
ncbi:hypothetical protein M413DRAFT_16459 [Hebeloma cylindrosporum]|uniref:CSC1/OSCA1-like 7TM region domain-containing protein n=1 Tax=Hebeloma cylindrosporum TaxID=76867 RepID=A0A0C3CRV7_HEBCY|nr:hypothetical protein M413DRAFT_16459 [Hebeloma cylindrosporum h7]